MKIIEAINMIDDLKHNTYSQVQKIGWLSRLDAMVKRMIIDTHEGGENVSFTGYNADTDLYTELLVPEPFDEMYLRWLEAQIDYHNGEYKKYNNAIEMFNTAYNSYLNYYNRNHMPLGSRFNYFGGAVSGKKQAATGGSSATIGSVPLLASKWVGEASPYSQVVSIAGVTRNSQVDLTPSVEQLAVFHDKDLAFVAENEDGVVTVYAIGDKPTKDYTMQVTIKEVSV